MRCNDKEPDHLGGIFPKQFSDRENIPQRFGHFLAINHQKGVMHPIARQWLTCKAF